MRKILEKYLRHIKVIGIGAIVGSATFTTYKYGQNSKSETCRASIGCSWGAMLAEVLCHPIDTLNMACKASPNAYSIQFLWRKYGITQLYRGIVYVFLYWPSFIGFYAIYYKLNDILKQYKWGKSKFFNSLLASVTAESCFILLTYPLELTKTRAQVLAPSEMKEFRLGKLLFNKTSKYSLPERIQNVYKGFWPYYLTYCVYVGFQYAIYSGIVHWFRERTDNQSITPPYYVIIAASTVSAIVASVISNPFEVWAVMTQTRSSPTKFSEILKSSRSIMRGISYRIGYNILLSNVLFIFLESCSALFGVQFSE